MLLLFMLQIIMAFYTIDADLLRVSMNYMCSMVISPLKLALFLHLFCLALNAFSTVLFIVYLHHIALIG